MLSALPASPAHPERSTPTPVEAQLPDDLDHALDAADAKLDELSVGPAGRRTRNPLELFDALAALPAW
jgi:hypothetical protein